jgi:Signal transduction histidine kinase
VNDLLIDAERHGEEVKTVLDRPETVIQRGPVTPLSILGDWSELSSALTNLVANAIRYSPDGSVIELSVKTRGDQAVLVVKDNGPGIPAEHLPRLTERFYRVDNSHSPTTGGTGLGLAIVKHILYRHEGELEIQSVMGEGAEFRCVLPATRINLEVQERTRA